MFDLKGKFIISALFLFSANAFAVNDIIPEAEGPDVISGDFHFKGNITDSSCDITQKDQEVELGTHSVAVLKENGSSTAPVEFTIDIKNCSLSMNALTIQMAGSPHAGNNAIFALDADDQSAGKIGIAIKTKDGEAVTPAGGSRNIPLRHDSRDYSLDYAANYQSTGLATPGKANATVNYTVTYN
ncbi:fimbrial protein [Morganella psychrotolerans]|uniref:fimbrial protein n=1 Tax=Morganella psychrotolerans TaxID=368603 RepID=UPI0039AF0F29